MSIVLKKCCDCTDITDSCSGCKSPNCCTDDLCSQQKIQTVGMSISWASSDIPTGINGASSYITYSLLYEPVYCSMSYPSDGWGHSIESWYMGNSSFSIGFNGTQMTGSVETARLDTYVGNRLLGCSYGNYGYISGGSWSLYSQDCSSVTFYSPSMSWQSDNAYCCYPQYDPNDPTHGCCPCSDITSGTMSDCYLTISVGYAPADLQDYYTASGAISGSYPWKTVSGHTQNVVFSGSSFSQEVYRGDYGRYASDEFYLFGVIEGTGESVNVPFSIKMDYAGCKGVYKCSCTSDCSTTKFGLYGTSISYNDYNGGSHTITPFYMPNTTYSLFPPGEHKGFIGNNCSTVTVV